MLNIFYSSNLQFSGKTSLTFMKLLGTIAFVSDEHFEEAYEPILDTPSGITIVVSDEHFLKALSPISIILFGMITVLISYSINAFLFNMLTLTNSGSSIPFNIVFPNKTYLPMVSTIFGIVILVSNEHSLKVFYTNICDSFWNFSR